MINRLLKSELSGERLCLIESKRNRLVKRRGAKMMVLVVHMLGFT